MTVEEKVSLSDIINKTKKIDDRIKHIILMVPKKFSLDLK